MQFAAFRVSQDDRFKFGVVRPQSNTHVPPGFTVPGFLTLVAFDRVAVAGFGVGGVLELNQHGFSLPRTRYWCAEQAERSIPDGRFHGFADDLSDKHPGLEVLVRFYCDPLEVIVIDVLRIAEGHPPPL